MQNKKIVVVDDQASIRLLLSDALQYEGYEVLHTASGPEALRFIEEFHPVLAILDVKMHGLDGIRIINQIRNKGFSIPVVIMSTNTGGPWIHETGDLGISAYLAKPFDIDEVITMIKRIADQEQLELV